jgi:hypothetical protein
MHTQIGILNFFRQIEFLNNTYYLKIALFVRMIGLLLPLLAAEGVVVRLTLFPLLSRIF